MKKYFLASFCVLLCGVLLAAWSCRGLLEKDAGLSDSSADGTAFLCLTAAAAAGRTALPASFDFNSDMSLSFTLCGVLNGSDKKISRTWDASDSQSAYSIMVADTKVSVSAGIWDFTLFVTKNGVCVLSGTCENKAVESGQNKLAFESMAASVAGTGSCRVTVQYPIVCGKVLVKACLCSADGTSISGCEQTPLVLQVGTGDSDGMYCAVYEKEGIAAGQYLAQFFFYDELNEHTALNVYTELVVIKPGAISSAVCTLSNINTLYLITYELNGGEWVAGVAVPSSFNNCTAVLLPDSSAVTCPGCYFEGWYNNALFSGEKVTEIPQSVNENKVVYARWHDITPPSPVTSVRSSRGNESVNLSWVNPSDADFSYATINWASADNPSVVLGSGRTADSSASSYCATGLTNGNWYIFTIRAVDSAENESTKAEKKGETFYTLTEEVTPAENNALVYFGDWPQSAKMDEVAVVASLPGERWPFKGDDGYYYDSLTVTYRRFDDEVFSGNREIVVGTTYYFKVEPIKWQIRSTSFNLNGTDTAQLLLSDLILSASLFLQSVSDRTMSGNTVYVNNYKYSEVRAYLNGYDGSEYDVPDFSGNGFLQRAFTAKAQTAVLTTDVCNDKTSFDGDFSKYACSTTSDKVFLLSYAELKNEAYGFYSNSDRIKYTTDYVRVNSSLRTTFTDEVGTGWWWQRSPYRLDDSYSNEIFIMQVYNYGGIAEFSGPFNNGGIVPALCIAQ